MQNKIENLWEIKEKTGILSIKTDKNLAILNNLLNEISEGKICVVEKNENKWNVNKWIKYGIIMYLGINDSSIIENTFFDKINNKFANWSKSDFENKKIRIVPYAYIRYGAYIDKNVIIMSNAFINIGANIGEGTMIDSLATIGSCVKIGKHCHISSNTVLAGVLEPVQDSPVIIEDNCFIGAGSQIAEGVIVENNSVIASGVSITKSTKIVDRETGEISYGLIKSGSVVISGTIIDNNSTGTACALIVKKIDEKTRKKTSLNDILRI